MPRVSRKDVELMIELLRRHSPPAGGAESEEGRLLRRLELRSAQPLEALGDWKRRGHTERARPVKRPRIAGRES
jgi:hypothetical protein